MAEKAQAQVKPVAVSAGQAASGTLQRKCACGTHIRSEQCDTCKGDGGLLQCKADGRRVHSEVPPIVHDVLRSPGQSLDAATRAFFEPRFGHDFSHVRLHTVARAVESTRAVNALAYTVGSHIAVRSDKHPSGTASRRRVIAHELAHVVQQSSRVGGSDPESSADLAAQKIIGGQQVNPTMVGGAPIGLYRQVEDPDLEWLLKLSSRQRQLKEISLQSAIRMANERKSSLPPIPATSPLLPQPSFSMLQTPKKPSWLKPGIDLRLPRAHKTENVAKSNVNEHPQEGDPIEWPTHSDGDEGFSLLRMWNLTLDAIEAPESQMVPPENDPENLPEWKKRLKDASEELFIRLRMFIGRKDRKKKREEEKLRKAKQIGDLQLL